MAFRRIGIDGRASAAATVLGLGGGVLAYRYAIKPMIQKRTQVEAAGFTGSTPRFETLNAASDLEALATGRVVVLITRGFSSAQATAARSQFDTAVRSLPQEASQNLRFFVIDDSSGEAASSTFLGRLGITNIAPWVVILDKFATTENKYLMTDKGVPNSNAIARFVVEFSAGKLKPARLGQPRPAGDRHPRFPGLYEVVTDSFADVVLDPSVDVLLEGYTPKCDACKALAPRWRMLSGLLQEAYPNGDCPLRVGAMNILDNDRPTEYMPEKWTPTIRLFPRPLGDTAPAPGTGLAKQSILLQFGDEDSPPQGLVLGGPGTQPAPMPADAAPKAVLPSLPEILDWAQRHTGGRVALPPSVHARAAALESEAADIERAYAITLQFMEVWHQFANLAADEEDDRRGAGGSGAPTQPGKADAAVSAELRKRIMSAYKFIVDDAAAGSAPEVVARLQGVSDVVAQHRVMERLQAAAAGGEGGGAQAGLDGGGGIVGSQLS